MSAQMSETMPLDRDAAWYADPSGAHEHRYWDGHDWTDFVSDDGVQSNDPLPPPPSGTGLGIEVVATSDHLALVGQERADEAPADEPESVEDIVVGIPDAEPAVEPEAELDVAEPEPKRRTWRRTTPAPLPPVEVPDGATFACHHRSNGTSQIVAVWYDRVERRSIDDGRLLSLVPGSRISSVEQRVLGARSIVQVNTYGPTVEFRVASSDGDDLVKAIGEIALATAPAVAQVS